LAFVGFTGGTHAGTSQVNGEDALECCMAHVLVLNATFEPLCLVPQRRAVVLLLAQKAILVEGDVGLWRSERESVTPPVVVRLAKFVRVPYRGSVPLTRRAVFVRDGGHCVYCGAAATSLDHVIPRSRGGEHSWDNVVSACGRCNHQKADRSVSDLGWRMRRAPHVPAGSAWRVMGTGRMDPRWRPYLDGWMQFEETASA
jgi:5-methylcytosine-specific restriction endonuclease McrA